MSTAWGAGVSLLGGTTRESRSTKECGSTGIVKGVRILHESET